MPVARADLEASAAIEIRSRIEIANGMNGCDRDREP
jgi:hypothetical protein